MPKVSRRHFVQVASGTLATLGLHGTQLLQHRKVLAQPTSRRLGLVIGINAYVDAPLYGCVNDAILQRQLLIHRFGFNPRDVVMLLDQQATRQGILDAIEDHLIDQAKPGDIVVVHFSGHGSLVHDLDPICVNPRTGEGMAGTLVPVDGTLPRIGEAREGVVPDIMGHTLFLLMSAIQTDHLTVVLDSCYAGAATRDDVRVRAREGGEGGDRITISHQEKAYQDRWLAHFGWSREEFVEQYQQGVARGVVLAATQNHQLAIDEQLNGFVAGAFSYRLTQHLWQQDGTPDHVLAEIQQQIPENYRQQPKLEVAVGSDYGQRPLYFVENPNATGHALVIEQEGDRVRLLLVGIDPGTVRAGTIFVNPDSQRRVTVGTRDGLIAIGQTTGSIAIGSVLTLGVN
ncbi:MAG: caspase family protein [Phormidium sp. GEM2.Bin31]|nr:MAG: caspase family protein [Phormidium sp. GEM2.Bin31]